MAVIFVLSAQPDFSFVPDSWQNELISLSAHGVEYAVLGTLLWFAASKSTRVEHPALFAFAASFLFALSDEFHQTFVPGRVADGWDILADAAGAAIALAIWTRRRRVLDPTARR